MRNVWSRLWTALCSVYILQAGNFNGGTPGTEPFFERCAQMLLELSDELERNLYIEAIVKEYSRYGISVENLKGVNRLLH